MNRKLLVFLRLVIALASCWRGRWGSLCLVRSERRDQEAAQPPAAQPVQWDSVAGEKLDARTRPRPRRSPTRRPSRGSPWWGPRGHLGGRPAAFAVRGVRPGRPYLRVDRRGDRLQDRRQAIDRLAYEFTKLLSVSFSLTATFGAALTFMLIILYPKFTNYLVSVFSPTFLPYVCSSSSRRFSSTPTTTAGGSSIR